MNIETGEVKNMDDLTAAERASGKWIPLPAGYRPRKYIPKSPATKHDFTRLQNANDRRSRKAQKRRQRS